MPEFFQTRMGAKFYEGTAPRIADALERIAVALEAIAFPNKKLDLKSPKSEGGKHGGD